MQQLLTVFPQIDGLNLRKNDSPLLYRNGDSVQVLSGKHVAILLCD